MIESRVLYVGDLPASGKHLRDSMPTGVVSLATQRGRERFAIDCLTFPIRRVRDFMMCWEPVCLIRGDIPPFPGMCSSPFALCALGFWGMLG